MGSMSARKASITIPKELELDLRHLAQKEHRTLSGLLQEAAKLYLGIRQFEELQKELSLKALSLNIKTEDDVDKIIHKLRKKKK